VAAWARRSGALGLTVAAGLLVAPRPGDARGLARPAVLASYSFDDDVATGPDTFAIWQGARHNKGGRGHVRLSSAFHVSGHRSVELMDVVGDGDFPELQGYFPVRRAGQLFFHFAFLTSDPQQELNVALAGPRYFQLEKDGIAFWLGTRDGRLVHYSDSIPKRLFVPEAFVWYAVDVTYDIAAGRYDLVIHAEGKEQPIVSLLAQPNAAGQPGSTVDKFSFVGAPFADTSSVVYYLDDVVIGTDESVTKLPFTAPGRRKLFVDSFGEYQRLLRERPRCLPANGPEDFGLAPNDLQALVAAGFAESLQRLIAAPGAPLPRLPSERGPERWRRVLEAVFAWNEGCDALERGDARLAHARFGAASEEVPEGPLFSRLQSGQPVSAGGRTVRPEEVMGPPRPGRKLVYTGDTRPSPRLLEAARNCDVLIHDATADTALEEKALRYGHSTGAQAAAVAQQCSARALILTHVSPRYEDVSGILAEARAIFPNAQFAEDFLEVPVPFPD